jgi:hypothetical protein
MAYYKIFPTQDTTLYSSTPVLNTGLDPICEISNNITSTSSDVARSLIQFDQTEISNIIDNIIVDKQFNAYLNQYASTISGINQNTYVILSPLAQSWNNGTGTQTDTPPVTDGASWGYSDFENSTTWLESGSIGGYNFTSSYSTLYSTQGGGNWFSTSSLNFTQSFGLRSDKDISINISPIVTSWYSGSIPNNGIISRLSPIIEFNQSTSNQPSFKYYSVDTNTIYPPQLEFRWDDSSTVLTGSLTSSIVNELPIKVSINENDSTFHVDSINRFRVNVSPLYPTRVFQTSSLYTSLNYLPTSSYYAVKDMATNEYVINFDINYTKISSDIKGNYFDIYMSGLEPERYYSILIKTVIDNSVLVLDNDYYFKVHV